MQGIVENEPFYFFAFKNNHQFDQMSSEDLPPFELLENYDEDELREIASDFFSKFFEEYVSRDIILTWLEEKYDSGDMSQGYTSAGLEEEEDEDEDEDEEFEILGQEEYQIPQLTGLGTIGPSRLPLFQPNSLLTLNQLVSAQPPEINPLAAFQRKQELPKLGAPVIPTFSTLSLIPSGLVSGVFQGITPTPAPILQMKPLTQIASQFTIPIRLGKIPVVQPSLPTGVIPVFIVPPIANPSITTGVLIPQLQTIIQKVQLGTPTIMSSAVISTTASQDVNLSNIDVNKIKAKRSSAKSAVYSVRELRRIAGQLKISTSGNKSNLVRRIKEKLSQHGITVPE